MNPLDAALKRIEGKFDSFGSRISSIGKAIGAIGGAVAIKSAVIDPVSSLITSFADAGSEIADMSARTGAGASSLSAMGFAASMTGSDLGTVEGAMKKLSINIIKGDTVIEALGFNMSRLRQMSPEDQFEHVGKAIAQIEDPTLRTAVAVKVMGKSGSDLIPMLQSFDELKQDAEQLGAIIDERDAERADALGDSFDRVTTAITSIGRRIVSAVAEPLTGVTNSIANIIGWVANWTKRNEALVQQIITIGAVVLGIGTALVGVSAAVIGVGATFSALGAVIGSITAVAGTVFSAIGSAALAIVSPIGLVVTAIAGIGAYLVYTAVEATGGIQKLGEMFVGLGGTATEAWSGIVAALSAGDLALAGEIAFTSLEVAWLQVTSGLRSTWDGTSAFLYNVWLNMVESIVQAAVGAYSAIAGAFDSTTNAIIAAFDIAGVYVYGFFDEVTAYIQKALIAWDDFWGTVSDEEAVRLKAEVDTQLEKRKQDRQAGIEDRASNRGTASEQKSNERQQFAKDFSKTVSEDFARKRADTTQESPALSKHKNDL